MDIRKEIVKYIKSLSENDRLKLKEMVHHNIQCCNGLAMRLKVGPDVLMSELREIF